MDVNELTTVTFKGTLWAYINTYGGKLLAFVATTILARLLLKEDFGIAGYALIFIGFLETINGLGVGSALIFFPIDGERYNTAFWLGLSMGVSLFIFSWFGAPLVGMFFNDMRAVEVTRVLALTFPISALGIVHEAILRKDLAFKVKAIPDFTRNTSKGIVSIILAILGFGAWSLIAGQLAGVLFSMIAYWVVHPWRPALRLKREFLWPLTSYGSSIVSVTALGALILNADYLLVGRYLGPGALGVYTLAFRVPDLLIGQFSDILGQVLFPVYSKLSGSSDLIKRGLFMTRRYVSMVTVPIGVGLAMVSSPFVLTFFTEKWSEAIPILALIAISSVINSFGYNFGAVYKAQGKPELLTKLLIFRAFIFLPVLWWAVTKLGTLLAVGWVVVFGALIGTLAQFYVAKAVINISFQEIFESFRPALICGAIMVFFVHLTRLFTVDLIPLLQLFIMIFVGGIAYLGALWFFQREDAVAAFEILRKSLFKK